MRFFLHLIVWGVAILFGAVEIVAPQLIALARNSWHSWSMEAVTMYVFSGGGRYLLQSIFICAIEIHSACSQ